MNLLRKKRYVLQGLAMSDKGIFNKILIFLGLRQSEEDKKILERWKYAKDTYGAELKEFDYGRWRLILDPYSVRSSQEFQAALIKAKEICQK
jgi:hypothetical protein